MRDKKNRVLFTNTECLILSHDFKLPDESQVLLRVPRKNNMYNVNLKNIIPSGDLTCLFAKTTIDESNLWRRMLGHINSKTINKLNVPSFVHSTEQVKSLRPSVQHVETSIPATTPKLASLKPTSNGKRRNRKACFVCKSLDHLIKDCDYHKKKMAQPTARNHAHRSKPVPITTVRPISTTVLKISVTRPRHAKFVITKPNSPPRRHINRSPFPKASNSPPRVTAVKAPVVNAAKGLQGKWEWKLKCLVLDHVSRNTSASMTLKRVIHNMLCRIKELLIVDAQGT
uniref:Ribonuclease H-like domain-containing protein n=1 Tax=Tanacetum cinerariifolium TaxID=118510 RepID=A0A6L2KCS5_TANCI|nr:ribonuclease H-like domain-containing protein [Tanacetum cinerariifolium]